MAPHRAITPTQFEAERRAIEADLTPILQTLSPAQFNWQPDAGRAWSVGQCVDHLARTNRQYCAALREAVARARPRTERTDGVPNLLGRWFIARLEPPVRLRVPAPRSLQPAATLDPIAVRREFDASLDEIRDVLALAWSVDLSHARFRNPLAGGLPVFNIATGFLVMLAHMRRHAVQVRAVMARSNFPSA
ncbi:MAG: DinB family protein [Acidobacteria bacterium]|jgi:hypothetical protein|nr:DinB family protein [Acidobacteriota bacterium]